MTIESDEKRVLAAVSELNGGHEARARSWYETEKLPALDGATAQELVQRGRTDDVLRLLEMYDAGPAG